MPRSFLVKKYLKQKYDEDQIKLQQQQQAQERLEKEQQLQQDQELQQALRDHRNNNNNNDNSSSSSSILITNKNIINNNILNTKETTDITGSSYLQQDKSHIVTSLVSSPLKSHVTPLSVRLTNGYIQDLRFQTTRVAEIVDSAKIAVIPQSEYEVAARENYHQHHQHQHHQHHQHHHQQQQQHLDSLHAPTRRSVIVTNNNHPSNRSYPGNNDNFLSNYDAIHSPGLPSENEQNAPYDYSIRKEDKEPKSDSAIAPSSPKRFKSYSPTTSPAPAHNASSPASFLYPPHLPSPPPAHQGIDPATATASVVPAPVVAAATAAATSPSPISPRGSPAHEGLPADHPFHHPLIQQLINQRLHVPGENEIQNDDKSNVISNIPSKIPKLINYSPAVNFHSSSFNRNIHQI